MLLSWTIKKTVTFDPDMDPDQASEQSESSDEILFSQKKIPVADGDPKVRGTWIKSKN